MIIGSQTTRSFVVHFLVLSKVSFSKEIIKPSMDNATTTYTIVCLSGVIGLLLLRQLYPRPLPGIPYVKASAQKLVGDLPHIISGVRETDEIIRVMFEVSTRKLGAPIAQLLFPSVRPPTIMIDDPYEVEDILFRRQKDFDKSPASLEVFKPMFPLGTLSLLTTPEMRRQKHLWVDTMHPDFLRRIVAPNIHKTFVDLVALWSLKASTIHKDEPFEILEDCKTATFDSIWVALIGKEPGITRLETKKLQGPVTSDEIETSSGVLIKAEIDYIFEAIGRCTKSIMPIWALRLETWKPRWRQFRNRVTSNITSAMRGALTRYERLQTGMLEADDTDSCMMDLVLRRRVLEAKKTGTVPGDPTKDQHMLDEMFVMLVGVSFPFLNLSTFS
jgi:hypothetical protein